MQKQLHSVSLLSKLYSSKILISRKGKWVLWENGEFSHTLQHTENCLECWFTFTYVVNSNTVEMETPPCPVHHKEYFKLPTFFIKIFI